MRQRQHVAREFGWGGCWQSSPEKNPVHHDRSKHIDTKYHFIRDCVDGGHIKLEHVEIARQLGDILTKPLGRVRLTELRTKIGVEEIKQEQCD